ncbi:MAG: preprotein translocase subunit YajC [Mariniblastus sp.]|nr:preprotein translocase subunit YajC [Mariniblastus sp.]
MVNLYNICWYLLAQTQVVSDVAEKTGGTAANTVETPETSFFSSLMFPILMGALLLYFLMMTRPKPKNQVKASELLANLKKNDRVVTAGGILGTVVNYRSDAEYVTIRIDDSSNTRMQVLATSLIRVLSDENSKDKD